MPLIQWIRPSPEVPVSPPDDPAPYKKRGVVIIARSGKKKT